MRALLDTHVFLWWLSGDPRLSRRMRALLEAESSTLLVSAASAWEIATKFRIGKLPGADSVAADVSGTIAGQGFEELAVSVAHGQRAGLLPGSHCDPFDRMLAAQAQLEGLSIVSADDVFDSFGCPSDRLSSAPAVIPDGRRWWNDASERALRCRTLWPGR